jgi:hypothetical protein
MRYTILIPALEKSGDTTLYTGDKDEIVAWLMNQADVKQYAIRQEGSAIRLTAGQFLANIVNVVPKYYQMDPETEDLLPNGSSLANGMKVLLADPDERGRPEKTEDWELDRALERNRWCTITDLKIKGQLVIFVAVYADGTKRKRKSYLHHSWLVKIDSITDSMVKATKRYNDILDIVKEGFDKHDEYCCTNCYGGSDAPSNEDLAEEITKKILGSL